MNANTKEILMNTWAGAVDKIYAKSFLATLENQISGECDMSAEDMTDEIAETLGWELPMTDKQADQWEEFVGQCAVEFLMRRDIKIRFPEADKLTADDVVESTTDANFTSLTQIQAAVDDFMGR